MTGTRCSACGKTRAAFTTTSGRELCAACFQDLAGFAGAGTALADGHGVTGAVAAGIATRGYAGAMAANREYQRSWRAKLDQTEGFWRRLWVRIVG